ncbi:SDR family NAD(P)-dependent oxidoreductase, partial [Ornithobacterium rhinotracheale]
SRVFGFSSAVSSLENEDNAVKAVLAKFGQLDVVLANAGVGHFAPVDELTPAQWHQMLNTNLNGAFPTLKASVEALQKSKGYSISLASLAGTNFFA